MTKQLTRVEICCDSSCENYNISQEIPLTSEEISQIEADALAFAEEQAVREAEAQDLAALKQSARAKLITGQPLTEEEAATIVI